MGRIVRRVAGRRVLVGLILVTAVALAACDPLKAPVEQSPPPEPPTAAFSASTSPLVASFSDQSTGVITVWSWDFGDGESSSEQSPTHTYATHGVYTVTLTVTGPGGSDSIASPVTVLPPPPVASFTVAPPMGIVGVTEFSFTDTSTGVITDRSWDLDGDGVFDDATGPSATATFGSAGNHTIGLMVSGPGGNSTASQTVPAALPPAPVASFNAMPTSGDAPVTVNFTDQSTGIITTREWDFNGDGVPDASGPSATHTFATVGVHQVALLVTGPGGSTSATQAITVTNTLPTASITTPANGATFTSGSAVTFTGTANDAQDGNISASIQWSSSLSGALGSGASIQSSSLMIGTHTITASVADSNLGTDTDQITITITPPPPIASFNAAPTVGEAPLLVGFTDTSTGTITGWLWNFGDGSTSTAQSPSHTYAAAGSYSVILTVTGPGGSDSDGAGILVSNPDGGGGGICPRCEREPG